ncbi:MAG: UDP-N-acetylmuramoyl-tripeptide--D-alanyl-D-alanine ligase [Deltaproteobacteria bacterium]|nr:UDP-N-acetylmuramoyl-tripeptide--D-alanyl-D-alanine ligase [Deltaproteobacteria bacterium]
MAQGLFDLAWVARACGGKVVGDPGRSFDRFVKDSREDVRDALYVALRGERFDGHAFLAAAASAGAAAALVEDGRFRPADLGGLPAVVVPDAVRALGDVARAHRRRMPARVLALTGSCGKTTTKEMLAAILRHAGPTLATEGNLNNQLGVPLTLLGLRPEHRFAVVELGCNHPGEIAALAAIAEPELGLVTCVAAAHLEGLGSIDGVARAKGELFAALDRPEAVAVVNLEDERVAGLPTGRARRLGVGLGPAADVRLELPAAGRGDGSFSILFPDGRRARATIALPGRHIPLDAALAAAAARSVGASAEAVEAGLSGVAAARHRGEILTSSQDVVVLDDTYNANPGSMRAALDALDDVPGTGRKVAILGEMLELGEATGALHHEVGAAAGRSGLGFLVCVGPSAERMAEGARTAGLRDVAVFESVELLVAELGRLVRTGDRVLVKGSRGMRMERVVEGILRGAGDAV